jgi:hypothetical protein
VRVGALRRGDRSISMGSPQKNAALGLAQAQGYLIFRRPSLNPRRHPHSPTYRYPSLPAVK